MSAQQTIAEKIKQRRRQMLVHSYLYYEKDTNIVSDSKWAEWAKELEQLQKDYPKESAEVEFAEQFVDWDGSSGAHLKYSDNIKRVAEILLSYQEKPIIKSIQKPVKKKKETSVRSLF